MKIRIFLELLNLSSRDSCPPTWQGFNFLRSNFPQKTNVKNRDGLKQLSFVGDWRQIFRFQYEAVSLLFSKPRSEVFRFPKRKKGWTSSYYILNGKIGSGSFFGFDPKINVYRMSFHLPGISKEVGISSWWKSCCTQSLNLSSVNHFFVAMLYLIVQKFFFWFPYLAKLFFPCISLPLHHFSSQSTLLPVDFTALGRFSTYFVPQ